MHFLSLKSVAVVLNKVAEVEVVVRSPPFKAMSPENIALLLQVFAPATVCAFVKSTQLFEVDPVPPLAIGRIPVTSVVRSTGPKVIACPLIVR